VLPPFLQEIGIAASLLDDQLERVVGEFHTLVARRFGERDASRRRRKRTDLRKVEQTLRVGLCAARLSAKLRQAGTDEDNRQRLYGY
jgi:hypothetical protein